MQELESFPFAVPLMGYTYVLIYNTPPTLNERRARRLTRRDELAALNWVRQWPKSLYRLCGQNVIRVTLLLIEAVALSIYDHSFAEVKIGGELYNHIMAKQQHIGHNIGPDEANKRLNIGMAMYGAADPAFRDAEEAKVEDPSDGYTSELFGVGWEQMPAPSTGKRRRALWIGYHRGMKVLVVIFTTKTRKTADGARAFYGDTQPWVKYMDVDLEMWEELTGYHSTGEWLKFSGVERNYYYPTRASDIDRMTEEYVGSLKKS